MSNTGKLGMVLSLARYKRDVHDMDKASGNLMKLRPVTFRYKDDPQGIKQYGLIAEEVEPLYPELVIHSTDGQVQSVRYSMLTSMLLNELQKQAVEVRSQTAAIQRLSAQVNEERTSRKREIEGLRNTFTGRLAVLKQALVKLDGSSLADAFDR